jgi:hypothetical protein
MYDIDHQELETGVTEQASDESVIDDTLMADPDGAVEEPVGDAPPRAETESPAPRRDNRNWFVVHTYSVTKTR